MVGQVEIDFVLSQIDKTEKGLHYDNERLKEQLARDPCAHRLIASLEDWILYKEAKLQLLKGQHRALVTTTARGRVTSAAQHSPTTFT